MLLITAMLWGSSFPAIKAVVASVDEMTYTWVRSAVALLGISPYIIYQHAKHNVSKAEVVGGLATGVTYSVGLWLQGWGTRFTTASNSAFITGLNVVFVHIYDAVAGKSYPFTALASLIVSVTGLYILTKPGGGIGVGEWLVLASAVFWAAQVILVSRFSRSNPITFTFYEVMPSLAFLPLSFMTGVSNLKNLADAFPLLLYLGLMCTNLAFISQVYGQKWLRPYEAALVLLLEPLFAAAFSAITLGERFNLTWIMGAALIITGIAIAIFSKKGTQRQSANSGNSETH